MLVFLLFAIRETILVMNILPGSYSKTYGHDLSDYFPLLADRLKLLYPVQGVLFPSV